MTEKEWEEAWGPFADPECRDEQELLWLLMDCKVMRDLWLWADAD